MSVDRLLRLAEVATMVSLSGSRVRQLVIAQRFPQPTALSTDKHGHNTSVRWSQAEVQQWIAARLADRRATQFATREGVSA